MDSDRLHHILVFLAVAALLVASNWYMTPGKTVSAFKTPEITQPVPTFLLASPQSPAEPTTGTLAKLASTADATTTPEPKLGVPLPKSIRAVLPELQVDSQTTSASATTEPTVGASVALAVDLGSGRTLFSSNADRRWPLASLTKLMTAVVATNSYKPEDIVTASFDPTPLAGTGGAGTVVPGERFTVKDLLGMMLVSSSNEAAETLAGQYPTGRTGFIVAMNSKAAEFGMTDTNYTDPTGLAVTDQSTPADLERLVTRIYSEYPNIFKTTQKKTWTGKELATRRNRTVKTTNNFAGQPDFLGGKTGFTDDAGGNLISLFNVNRSPVFILVMGADDRFGATTQIVTWLKGRNQIGG